MKKLLVFLTGVVLLMQQGYSQPQKVWAENFDGPSIAFTKTPPTAWGTNTSYFWSAPNSCWGRVPLMLGDSIMLTTPVYDLGQGAGYGYALLRFSHICKLSPSDTAYIEYRTSDKGLLYLEPWRPIPVNIGSDVIYKGTAANYASRGFYADSYSDWQVADSTAIPSNTWWKEESFDLSNLISYAEVQFRFIIKRGRVYGSDVSYGWLLDNFELTAYVNEPPAVAFVAPLVKDTVYSTGPWEINAKVKAVAPAKIAPPYLKWSSDNWQTYDSTLMTMVRGDSLWKASIPQYPAGTNVRYSITGIDSSGCDRTESSNYIIVRPAGGGQTGYDTIGRGTTTSSYFGLVSYYNYGWSRQIYLASEIDTTSAGGLITEFAWHYAASSTIIRNNQKCYFQAVDATTVVSGYEDPVAEGATLVYQGNISLPAGPTWANVPLMQPFVLPPGKNLMVYWINESAAYNTSATIYVHSIANMGINGGSDNSWATAIGTAGSMGSRPNARFYLVGASSLDYSASMHSIDMSDTILTSPTTFIPIVVTVRNEGRMDLDSVTVSYAINGTLQKDTTLEFNPALPWDFVRTDTVGYYSFAPNKFDTLTAWVKLNLPNGVYDSTTYDDTLTKKIYGTSDIIARWISVPKDTVYNTGPHTITAEIYTLSGAAISDTVKLYISDTLAGYARNYDSLVMLLQGANLYTAEIPNILFGSIVTYSIRLIDTLLNNIELSGSYHILKKPCVNEYSYTGSVETIQLYAGTWEIELWGADGGNANTKSGNVCGSTVTSVNKPWGYGGYSKGTFTINSSQTVHVYVGGAGTSGASGGGWNGGGNSLGTGYGGGGATDIRVGGQALTDRIIVAGGGGGNGQDGSAAGGLGGGVTGEDGGCYSNTYVAGEGGTQFAGGAGGIRVNTTTAFTPGNPGTLGQGGSASNSAGGTYGGGGGGGGYYGGGAGATSGDSGGGGGGSGNTNGTTNGSTRRRDDPLFVAKPVSSGNGYVRMTLIAGDCGDKTSVAMDAILSPQRVGDAGALTPVTVRIRNKGTDNLTSCELNYSVNGTTQLLTPYLFNGINLPDDFTDTVTIGYYNASLGGKDTIVAWVSQPNGVTDPTTSDDTLQVVSTGCYASPSVITIGAVAANYTTINEALDVMLDCGVSQNTTLLVNNGTYTENLNLTNISQLMQNYTLTIQSTSGNRNNVIICPTTGRVVELNNTHNIIFKDITLSGDSTTTHVVDFTGAASNIVFENCVIKTSITTTAAVHCFNKTSSAVLDNVSIKHCKMDGGSNGVNMNVSSSTTPLITHLVIDSNECSNQYTTGMYFNYVFPNSVSYNKITPRSASQATTWLGFYMAYAQSTGRNCNVIGNSVSSNNTDITTGLYGMDIRYSDGNVLVANNEVYLNSFAGTTRGIYCYYNYGAKFFHNTVLLTGTGGTTYAAFAWYASSSTTYSAVVKNNIFAANKALARSTAYAVHIDVNVSAYQAQYLLDYNTYYSNGTSLNRLGTVDIVDLTAWQASMTADTNAIVMLPIFVDPTVDLKLGDYIGLDCPALPEVADDIDGFARTTPTTKMGCYELSRFDNDAQLVEILDVIKVGLTAGQSHPIRVVVRNKGWNDITSLSLEWLIDDILPATTVSPSIFLTPDQVDTIALGNLPYTTGDHILRVQVKTVNGVPDDFTKNDTLEAEYSSCSSALGGIVTVGTTGQTYTTIASVIDAIELCGIAGGKITLELADETFEESVDFSTLWLKPTDTLELVSLTGNAVIETSDPVGIKIGNLNNIVIKNITINMTGASIGILMGAGNNIEISDCRINLDTNLGGSVASNTHVGIYKPAGVGNAHYVKILNNVVRGGYNGIVIYGGNENAFDTNWIFDGNTVQAAYFRTTYIVYVDFLSVSNNTTISMTTTTYTATDWTGFMIQMGNIKVMEGNRVLQRVALSNPIGIFLYGINANIAPAEVRNNELIMRKTGTSYSSDVLSLLYSSVNLHHNSVSYVAETAISESALLYIDMTSSVNSIVSVKNNNFVANLSIPIYLDDINPNSLTLDYNNYYTGGTRLGYYNGYAANLAAWKTLTSQDANSVSMLPTFPNSPQSLEVSKNINNLGIYCPALPSVLADINDSARGSYTAMGAYEFTPSVDMMVKYELYNFPTEAVLNQNIPIVVEVTNYNVVPITEIAFEYAFNGGTPVTYVWNPATPLAPQASDTVHLGSFIAVTDTSIDVQIVTINTSFTNAYTASVAGHVTIVPLAKFTAPLVAKTISARDFRVFVYLYEHSGAITPAPPYLVYRTVMGNCMDVTDSVQLEKDPISGNWSATIPPQYYGSTVTYSLHVADDYGNIVDLIDSTYIQFDGFGGNIMDYAYTGSVQPVQLKSGTYEIECWGADGGNAAQGLGGKGGYSRGILTITSSTTYYVYVGGKGTTVNVPTAGGWNGGGSHAAGSDHSSGNNGGTGGGGTDIRTTQNTTYADRIIVAGGGGGASGYNTYLNGHGGNGGGLTGQNGVSSRGTDYYGLGGTQSAGGAGATYMSNYSLPGGWGIGGDYIGTLGGTAGGGGYYGGGSGHWGGGAGGGSGYIDPSFDSALTVQFTASGFVANPDTSGNGFVRITPMGGQSYHGYNLSILSIVSPVNNPNELCGDTAAPVTVVLANMGDEDYNFAVNNITIGYEITYPASPIPFTDSIFKNTGMLEAGQMDTIVVMPSLALLAGSYTITAWVTSSIDIFPCDDTASYTYVSGKLQMPLEEEFSNSELPVDFTSIGINTPATWDVMQGSDGKVVPQYGTGMLRFGGTTGAVSQLYIRPIDIYDAQQPTLSFWYYHDTVPCRDYTFVKVVLDGNIDGGQIIQTIYKQDTLADWVQYDLDLSAFTKEPCFIIVFQSMSYTSTQYIDKIYLYAAQNLAVESIITSPISECDFNNKDMKVVLRNTSVQNIDFKATPTRINLRINSQNYIHTLDNGILQAKSRDTIIMTTMNLVQGTTYYLTATIMDPIDGDQSDDTFTDTLIVNPDVAIEIIPNTDNYNRVNCFPIGATASQRVIIRNNGNFDIFNLPLVLEVHGKDGIWDSLRDTLDVLPAGDSKNFTFSGEYSVPVEYQYIVVAEAILSCDANPGDNKDNVAECVELDDIEVAEILKPDGASDNVGDAVNLVVQIVNKSEYESYRDVVVHAQILDGNTTLDSFYETIDRLVPDRERDYMFTRTFNVPSLKDYTIKVFIDKQDNNQRNDTLSVNRKTNLGIITPVDKSFSLGQNIPNPAKDNTRIEYNLPEDGQVIFTVYTITGQILHTETKEANSGKSKLEFNTINLANGIYYYSMEYKGERLVKKMTIQK